MTRSCQQCGKSFEAQRETARFCSSSCRSRASQGVAPVVALADVVKPAESSGLLASVVARVELAGLLGTPDGEGAIDIARRMVDAADSSYAGMHRQLVVALERIDALAPVQSSVDELRMRRDHKRRRA